MKYNKILIALAVIAIIFTSCYKEDNWLDDNIKEGGNYFPQIPYFEIQDGGTDFYFGDKLSLKMSYFSTDEVATTSLSLVEGSTETLLQELPFSSSYYSEERRMDEVIFDDYVTKMLPSVSTLAIMGTVTTTKNLSKNEIIPIFVCGEEILNSYNSNFTYTRNDYFYNDPADSTIVTDTIVIQDTLLTTIELVKIDDANYTVDDLTFGYFKSLGLSSDVSSENLNRSICHFDGSGTALIDDIDMIFSTTGIYHANNELVFEWEIEGRADGNLVRKISGKSLLSE